MDAKRTETIPTCLIGVTIVALGLSWVVVQPKVPHEKRSRLASEPMRHERPLQWPSLVLAPLPVDAPIASPKNLNSTASTSGAQVAVAPSFSGPLPLAQSSTALDHQSGVYGLKFPTMAVSIKSAVKSNQQDSTREHSQADQTTELVIMLPSTPLLTAAAPSVRLVEHESWSWFGYSLLSPLQRAGTGMDAVSSRNLLDLAFARIAAVQKLYPVVDNEILPIPVEVSILVKQQASAHAPGPVLITPKQTSDTAEISKPSLTEHLQPELLGALLPKANKLTYQLGRLAEQDATGDWAWKAAYRLRGVSSSTLYDSDAISRSLTALGFIATQADDVLEESQNRRVNIELARAKYALQRRVATWSAVMDGVAAGQTISIPEQRREEFLAGARWAMAPNGWAMTPRMTYSQASKIDMRPIRIAKQLDAYEEAPSNTGAREIVEQMNRYKAGGSEAATNLSQAIEEHYRNANFRLAISQDLVNRLLPQQDAEVRRVQDRIVGTPVSGQSKTNTKVKVRVIPDPHAWRIGLEARGNITSRTVSHGGPAKLHSRGSTSFVASKQILVHTQGIDLKPTQAKANSQSRLVGLTTSYDRVPFISSYARSKAKSEYARYRNRARTEVEHKVTDQIARTMDQRTQESLDRLQQRYEEAVLGRANNLGLEVEPLEMRTTDSRWIARLRLAGNEQLAAHTPRMRAPSDSLVSMQLHESAINNVIEGIGLDGQRMTTTQLNEHLVQALSLKERGETPNEQATLHFAPQDAARVSFEEGQVKLTLALREMVVRGSRHRNFKVHVHYRPAVEGAKAVLVQAGTPAIEGRMRTGKRLQLHGALGKVLGEDRRIELVKSPAEFAPKHADKLKGIAPTQFVVEDGWLGLAVGPQRVKQIAVQVGNYLR